MTASEEILFILDVNNRQKIRPLRKQTENQYSIKIFQYYFDNFPFVPHFGQVTVIGRFGESTVITA